MIQNLKTEFFTGSILDLFHLRPLDFHDPSAIQADQVIMVRPFGFDFEARPAIGGGHPLDEPAFLEHLNGPEYRYLADAPVANPLMDIFKAQMAIRLQQVVQYGGSLRSKVEILAL